MPYVQRNELGHITGLSDFQQYPEQEFVENAVLYITPDQLENQKDALLVIARANRELILNRLNGHLLDAILINDTTAITAITTCKTSLKEVMQDPRVINAVNGAVKQAVLECYQEIIIALAATAPHVLIAFKDLDKI